MAVAIPATLATLAAGAYVNARFKLSDDFHFLSSYTGSMRTFDKYQKAGRSNPFYRVEEHARDPKLSNEPFLIYEGKSWTFKQYYDVVLRYAGWLHKTHHVVKGEIVALDMMNSPSFCFLVPALWSLGASPALINYNLVGKSLVHCVKVSTARLLLIDPEVAPKALTKDVQAIFDSPDFRNNAFPLEYAVLDEGLEKSLKYFPPYRAPDTVRNIDDPRNIANLMYTSGTTGLPKAAIQPWSRVAIGGDLVARMLRLKAASRKDRDRFYTSMPLYHTTAFTLGFNACLQSATTFVLGRRFSVSNFWPEVRAAEVTVIQYVGETLRYLLAAPLSPEDKNHNVRMAWGNGLRPDVWAKFKARFGIETIAEVYGATEGVAATFNINNNSSTDGAIASYGKITELMSRKTSAIVLVDWETERPWRDPKTGLCKQAEKGQVGELLFVLDPAAIQAKFAGYLNNKEANDSKVLRDVLKKGDAYFRTGDTVRFDQERGALFFVDRIGDTYRWKSENVSTAEVSEVLGNHRAVLEANVYGVEVPGHEGRAGCVAIMLHDGALEPSGSVKEDALESLATHSSNSLPKYAVPLFLRVVKEMQMTGNNKQQKTRLRKEGIDLSFIRKTGSTDRLYWLRPGANRYVEFEEKDLQLLEGRKIRL